MFTESQCNKGLVLLVPRVELLGGGQIFGDRGFLIHSLVNQLLERIMGPWLHFVSC